MKILIIRFFSMITDLPTFSAKGLKCNNLLQLCGGICKSVVLSFGLIMLLMSCVDESKDPLCEDRKITHPKYLLVFHDNLSYNMVLEEDLMTGPITFICGSSSDLSELPLRYGIAAAAMFAGKYVGWNSNQIGAWTVQNNKIELDDQFIYNRANYEESYSDYSFLLPIDDQYLLSVEEKKSWLELGSRELSLISINDQGIKVTKTIEHPMYRSPVIDPDFGVEGLYMSVSGVHAVNGKLYVSFTPYDGRTPKTDTAFVSVFTYPELEYIKTIEDTRTGPVASVDHQVMMKDEEGNLFMISSSAYGYEDAPIPERPSGVLKINAGEDDFDPDYFFNVEEAYSCKVLNGFYIGNNKAIARVADIEPNGATAYRNIRLVILDLEKKTLKEVSGLPLQQGVYTFEDFASDRISDLFSYPYLIEDGKVYTPVYTGDLEKLFIYKIDPETYSAVKGAEVYGYGVLGLFPYQEP